MIVQVTEHTWPSFRARNTERVQRRIDAILMITTNESNTFNSDLATNSIPVKHTKHLTNPHNRRHIRHYIDTQLAIQCMTTDTTV